MTTGEEKHGAGIKRVRVDQTHQTNMAVRLLNSVAFRLVCAIHSITDVELHPHYGGLSELMCFLSEDLKSVIVKLSPVLPEWIDSKDAICLLGRAANSLKTFAESPLSEESKFEPLERKELCKALVQCNEEIRKAMELIAPMFSTGCIRTSPSGPVYILEEGEA